MESLSQIFGGPFDGEFWQIDGEGFPSELIIPIHGPEKNFCRLSDTDDVNQTKWQVEYKRTEGGDYKYVGRSERKST